MKDDKRIKVLLKFIQRIHDEYPVIQEVIDSRMIEIYAEEGASPEQIFFILLYLYCFLPLS